MSRIRVNNISNRTDDGPVTFTRGISIPSGSTLSSQGGMNVVGIISSTSFSGNGASLTGINIASVNRIFAVKYILADPPLRS